MESLASHPLEDTNNVSLPQPGSSRPQQIMRLDDSKAGMLGLDLEKINKVISESSEGSKFYEHKRKAKERLEQKAREMREQYDRLLPSALEESQKKVDRIAAELDASKDDTRILVHIDMDCFFAAVEIRDNPSLGTKPMAVGSNSMLSTSNYIARKFGVRAAMPGFIARKLCPNLVIIPPDFEKYSAASAIARQVYREYDTDCYSCMDEASLDITEYVRTHLAEGEDEEVKIEEIVREIREKVREATNGLTCSAGISPIGFVSKICSDMNKPNGQFRLKPDEVANFIKNLKIRKVGGIGEATETLLRSLDIDICGDIWERRGAVNLLFKPATADFLLRVSLGIGKHFFGFPDPSTSSSTSDDRKSISCERTFSETDDPEFLSELCHRLCSDLAEDLKSKDCKCKAVAVKIKTDTFDVKTRVRTLLDYTSDPEVIFKTALSIWDSLRKEQEGMILRLFGVRIATLKFKNGADNSNSSSRSKQFWQNFMEPNSESSFECPICVKTFTTSFSLRKHVEACLEQSETSGKEIPQVPESSSESEKIGVKREYPEEDSSPLVVVTQGNNNVHLEAQPNNKRIKTATSNCNGASASSIGRLRKSGKSGSKSKESSTKSPIKMMPINFYFQHIPK